MVSPTNPVTPETTRPELRSDRGMIQEVATSYSETAPSWRSPLANYFWGSVIAGSLVTLSLFILSWYLMLGCRVGVAADGTIALGAGAGVWAVITACIAFFVGGWIANMISPPVSQGGLKGATIWGLTVPLAICLRGWAAGFGQIDLVHASSTAANASMNTVPSGFVWAVFLTLIFGLVFALIGGAAGASAMSPTDRKVIRNP